MLDLFCGRFGWGKAFAARGWECIGIDFVQQDAPDGCRFVQGDILSLRHDDSGWWLSHDFDLIELGHFDFICASSPCEQFSVHGMKHFHPNPPYPEMGLRLFHHTRALCEASGLPYVMENVRPAQKFVGNAVTHCGPFYLWGNAVPLLMPQGITKGIGMAGGIKDWSVLTQAEKRAHRLTDYMMSRGSKSKARKLCTALSATIPPELANAVVDYVEYVCKVHQ